LAELLTTVPLSVQLEKLYPLAGVAVTVTVEPQLTLPPPLTEPPAAGELLVPMVKVIGLKLATRLRFAVALNV
jgi:hypothetical protein